MRFPPLIELVPHRPPMLLIDEVADYHDRKIVCSTTVRADMPFVHEGSVSSVLAIELFAQTAAALIGLRMRERPGPQQTSGALLGTRELELIAPSLEVGDALTIECEELFTMDAAAQVQCALSRRGEIVARGTINVYAGELR